MNKRKLMLLCALLCVIAATFVLSACQIEDGPEIPDETPAELFTYTRLYDDKYMISAKAKYLGTEVEIPSTYNGGTVITVNDFGGTKMKKIILPDTIESISAEAFANCKLLKVVEIGSGLKYINVRAFEGCTSLESIMYNGSFEQWEQITKCTDWDNNTGKYTIFYGVGHEHTFAKDWTSDETYHWHEATCGHYVVSDKAAHDFYNGVCTVCGEQFDNVHKHTFATTWRFNDVYHWHEATCGHDVVANKSEHTFLTSGFCSTCGAPSKDKHEHTFAKDWTYDETYHWHKATCGHDETADKAEHSYVNGVCRCGKKQMFTVTFVADYKKIATLVVEYGGGLTKSQIPAVPSKTGYSGAWNPADLANVTSDLTVTAVYTAKSYTLTFEYNGATGGNGTTGMTVEYGKTIGALPAPVKTNFVFVGWTVNGNALAASGVWNIDGDATAVAQWKAFNTDGVEFTLNADGKSYSVTGIGDVTSTDVVIAGTYNGLPVTEIADDAFANNATITSVTIGEGVTKIGNFAFDSCVSLKVVNLPSTLTTVCAGAFQYCGKLTAIDLPSDLTSIGSGAFKSTGLRSILVPSKINKIEAETFRGCVYLASVTLPDGLLSIGNNAFCLESHSSYSLKKIVIPDTVQTIGNYAFCGCGYLQSVTLSKELLTIGDYAFCNCVALQSMALPNKLQKIGNFAFKYCSSLRSLTLPNKLQTIGARAYQGCEALQFVDIPDSVKTLGSGSFESCANLKEVTIGAGVEDIQIYYEWSYYTPFSYCTSLEKITVSAQNKKYYSSGNCIIVRETGALIVGCKMSAIPTDGSVKYISNYAFFGAGLRKITIPTSVTFLHHRSFCSNANLYYIYYLGTVDQWKKIGKDGAWNQGTSNYKVYCVDGIINYDGSVDPLPEA